MINKIVNRYFRYKIAKSQLTVRVASPVPRSGDDPPLGRLVVALLLPPPLLLLGPPPRLLGPAAHHLGQHSLGLGLLPGGGGGGAGGRGAGGLHGGQHHLGDAAPVLLLALPQQTHRAVVDLDDDLGAVPGDQRLQAAEGEAAEHLGHEVNPGAVPVLDRDLLEDGLAHVRLPVARQRLPPGSSENGD